MDNFTKTQQLAKELLQAIDRLQPQRKITTTNGIQQIVETRKGNQTIKLPLTMRHQSSSRSGSFR